MQELNISICDPFELIKKNPEQAAMDFSVSGLPLFLGLREGVFEMSRTAIHFEGESPFGKRFRKLGG